MSSTLSGFASQLRHELCARNAAFASSNKLAYVSSYGAVPVIVYAPQADGLSHGNFFDRSYAAILKNPQWARRLEKIHAQARRSLPRADRAWRELDSCMSSDALLMNIFCCPGVRDSPQVASMLGTEVTEIPELGWRARVPLANGRTDRTEIDMKLGPLFVEAKLTEGDFQTREKSVVESYRDLKAVFELDGLPRIDERYISYQLIRNVLAAHAAGASFCVMADARRPDLLEAWHAIMRCVRHADLRTRCKVLTWQELSSALPRRLRKFLFPFCHPEARFLRRRTSVFKCAASISAYA
ncbi:MAG TPA: hypothetical protein VNV88_08960 [Candidatus Solibacter sp.]|nr:hypothetical protein [Candidatus Solibacter sp.]